MEGLGGSLDALILTAGNDSGKAARCRGGRT
jgi:hypothetical protein